MRCAIRPDVRDGLKVIKLIPNIPTCMIEGRNGVGKTVAVQLLELISGSIPNDFVRRPALWFSLRDRLGNTSVELSDLRADKKLSVTFTPEAWDDAELPLTTGDWLGRATIDGVPASIAACASLLSVTRISGDEDLEVTLRRRVDTLSGHLSMGAIRVRQRGDLVAERLADIVPDLLRADPTEIERDSELLGRVEGQLAEVRDLASAADDRLRHLLRAIETKRQLDAAGQEELDLLTTRDRLLAQIADLNGRLVEQEDEAEAAEAAYSTEGDAQNNLALAERLLRHRRARHANLQREITALGAALSFDLKTGSAGAMAELARGDAELEDLTNRYRSLDSTHLVRDLITEVIPPLHAAQDEIRDQILIRMIEGGLTVSETLAGVTARRTELADQPEPEQLRELAAQIDDVKRRQGDLRRLLDAYESEHVQSERVGQAEAEAQQAAQQAEQASEAARRSREANQAVGATQQTLTEAYAELASVQQQIGSAGATSKEDAAADLASALRQLGMDESQLGTAEPAARTALAEADHKLAEVEASASAIRRRLTVRQADVDLAITRIRTNSQYRWILDATPDLLGQLDDPDQKYGVFGAVRSALINASESAYNAANLLSSLVGIAESFFDTDTVRANGPGELVQTLRPGFESVLGQRLQDALNSESIRTAIFDGAEVIGVEAGTDRLTLRDSKGDISRRSMDAFSSGERAFAFTQARIADLEPSNKPNRLLVLDEFGAYVAADRLPDLATFLATETQDVADQVIVILPLHVDYEAEIGETRGELRARYEERLSQIESQGYCAVSLA